MQSPAAGPVRRVVNTPYFSASSFINSLFASVEVNPSSLNDVSPATMFSSSGVDRHHQFPGRSDHKYLRYLSAILGGPIFL